MITSYYETIANTVKSAWSSLGAYPVLLFIITISFFFKGFILIFLSKSGFRNDKKILLPKILLLVIVIGSMVEDSSWIVTLTQKVAIPTLSANIMRFFIRAAWAFIAIKEQAFALFIEQLPEKKHKIRWHQIPFLIMSTGFFLFFMITATCYLTKTPAIFFTMLNLMGMYILGPVFLKSLFITLWRLRSSKVPKIIKRQTMVVIQFLAIPAFIANLIQIYPFNFRPGFVTHSYSMVSVVTIVMTIAIYYSARKIMGLRFLNFHNHVRGKKRFEFIRDFKNIIEQLGQVSSERELEYITKDFFKNAFSISPHKVHLYIRSTNDSDGSIDPEFATQRYKNLELFAAVQKDYVKQEKAFIADEVSFDNFYKKNVCNENALAFLHKLHADIVLFVKDKHNNLVGYLVVEKDARDGKSKEFYCDIEQYQMQIFSTYLGNIIGLLQHKNIDKLIAQEKDLREQLYHKHQEVNQYKESMRTFLRSEQDRKIGILFYKNRQFMFGNEVAQNIIGINLNYHVGHPVSKAIKKIAQQAMKYKTQQTSFVHDIEEKKVVLTAIPNINQNSVIIVTHYPEVADLVQNKMNMLNDPTKWDYLLYLETTKAGKLVNNLIPGTNETLLNFKINLLKAALNKKAVLLDVPKGDQTAMAELLHTISLRDQLHTLTLHGQTDNIELKLKLFGANPLFALEKNYGQPILEKLKHSGTLFIENIHFLDLETQELLAQFIQCGFYCLYKTNQKKHSDVRILCSSEKDLKTMVQAGTFSTLLFNQLVKTKLVMPTLTQLPEKDLKTLTEELIDQALQDGSEISLFDLTNSEKKKLLQGKPASIDQLKKRINLLINRKKEQHETCSKSYVLPAQEQMSVELEQALQLGKNALKDRVIMQALWNKFQNQSKIAAFLGVNRSSVNRRCKEYGFV